MKRQERGSEGQIQEEAHVRTERGEKSGETGAESWRFERKEPGGKGKETKGLGVGRGERGEESRWGVERRGGGVERSWGGGEGRDQRRAWRMGGGEENEGR